MKADRFRAGDVDKGLRKNVLPVCCCIKSKRRDQSMTPSPLLRDLL